METKDILTKEKMKELEKIYDFKFVAFSNKDVIEELDVIIDKINYIKYMMQLDVDANKILDLVEHVKVNLHIVEEQLDCKKILSAQPITEIPKIIS